MSQEHYAALNREKYAGLKAQVDNFQLRAAAEGRDMSAEELRTAEALTAEGVSLLATIEAEDAAREANLQVRTVGTQVRAALAAEQAPKGSSLTMSPAERGVLVDQFRAARTGYVEHGQAPQMRAALTAAEVGGGIVAGVPFVPAERHVFQFLGANPVQCGFRGIGTFSLPAVTSHAVTAEGSSKPEAAAPAEVDITVGAYSRWNDFSVQLTLANPGALDAIGRNHARMIGKDLDLITYTALNAAAPSAYTYTETAATPNSTDQTAITAILRGAVAQVTADTGGCDVVMMNAADVPWVSAFVSTDGMGVGSLVEAIGSARIYVTSEVPALTVLVANIAEGVTLAQAGPVATAAYMLSPKTNTGTLLTEGFYGVGITLSGAVRKLTLTAAS
jgi:hypothetical protein